MARPIDNGRELNGCGDRSLLFAASERLRETLGPQAALPTADEKVARLIAGRETFETCLATSQQSISDLCERISRTEGAAPTLAEIRKQVATAYPADIAKMIG